jgi:pilus assembly protein CpaC
MKKTLFIPILIVFFAVLAHAQQMVEIAIEITEINENHSKQYGIEFPGTIETGETLIPSLVETGIWERWTPFSAALKAMEADGSAKVLSKPKLVTKSGSTARFMVGGEFPVAEITASAATIEWKEYGIIMKITPVVLANGKIDLLVETELSRLDYNTLVAGYPSIAKRAAISHLIIKNGETMILAGLIETTQGKTVKGVPILSKIPLLGALFRTTSITESKTNLLVFVTPTLLAEKR